MIKNSCIVFLIYFLVHTSSAFANGAGWSVSLSGGNPGPVRQHDLFIEKEYVVFRDPKVTAKFWINNPTNNKIKITMGFPLVYENPYGRESEDENRKIIKNLIEDNKKTFDVKVNGSKTDYQINILESKDYPIVINWEMEFHPKKITKFIVTYPFLTLSIGSDNADIGGENRWRFAYITHTGSYWAKPIKSAIFEYYGVGVDLLANHPSGKLYICKNDGFDMEKKSFYVSPSPYVVDRKKKCIRWERKNWLPMKKKDDIYITMEESSASYKCWGGSYDEIWNHWCGLTKKFSGKQFANQIDFSKKVLTDYSVDILVKKSYEYVTGETGECQSDYCDPFYELPEHLSTKYKLMFLRYLRNYIAAKTGHAFKDQKLSKCFASRGKQPSKLSPIEIKNIQFIQLLEEITTSHFEMAYKKECQ